MTATRTKSQQLPLALDHSVSRSRDDLVVSPANKRAVSLIEQWPDWPSTVVVLVGPEGSGRTHLAAVWRKLADARSMLSSSIAEGTADLGAQTAVLIDDADAGGLDEVGLFHLVNHLRTQGGYLLLVARTTPMDWGIRLPDLRSRLVAASLVTLDPPDEALLSGVVAKAFADRQVEVEPHVIQHVVRRIDRSLPTALAAVNALDQAAMQGKRRITRAFAAEVLEAHEPP